MRLKSLATIGIASLGVAACGGSSSSSSGRSSASRPHTRAAASSRVYRLKLTGQAETPAGAPKGTGSAVIALHGRTLKVCWRFSHLRGFKSATFAHIHQGATGTSGNIVVPLSTSAKLHHRGCLPTSAALIKAIEKNPRAYYVNVHSKTFPGGAVRAQL